MKINDITSHGVAPVRGVASRTVTPASRPAEAESLPQDVADLRGDVRQEARILDAAKLVYEALPDVRADKVELARKRLAEGFYDRPEVQEQIAAKLAGDAEARPAPSLTLAQKADIQRRLAEGFYDRPEVVDEIARGLAEDVEG